MILAAILAELPQEIHDIADELHGELTAGNTAQSSIGEVFEAVVSGLQMLRDHPATQAARTEKVAALQAKLSTALHAHVQGKIAAAAAADAPATTAAATTAA